MSKTPKRNRRSRRDELRAEHQFDYRKSRSNRLASRLGKGAAAVVLEPDVAQGSSGDREEDVARGRTQRAATVGVAEHGNSVVLVTVGAGGELLDRRRIELTDRGLPTHPHHHEGSWAVGRYLNIPGARALLLTDAVALVERVRASAARGAREGLEALAAAVPVPIASIAIRACPELPPTTEQRIADNRAQTLADSVMYREALASAAQARGWSVHWYDRAGVFRDAAAAVGREDVDTFLQAMGRSIGPPWQAKHKLAAAGALAATGAARAAGVHRMTPRWSRRGGVDAGAPRLKPRR